MLKTISAYSPVELKNPFKLNLAIRKKQLKKYALKTALKSDYARRTYDVLPTLLISYVMRTVVDCLIFYRLYTTYTLLNLLLSIIVSVAVTITSPFFYDVVWQYKDHIQKFTDHIVDHMTWNYYFTWRNRIVLLLVITTIFILYMDWIVITNWWVIECIIHTLVCGFILGKYDEVKDIIMKPTSVYFQVYDLKKEAREALRFINPVHMPIRQIRYFNANAEDCFRFHEYQLTIRAKKVFINNGTIINNTINKTVNNNNTVIMGDIVIIADYCSKK